MNAGRFVGLVAAAAVLLHPGPGAACGDKLSMMGGGVGFERINFSRHRGSVVMLLAPDSPLRKTATDLELQRSLEKAGHRVRTLETVAELASVVQAGDVDVVLVDGTTADDLPRQVTTAPSGAKGPVILTVVYKSDNGALPAKQVDRLCVARVDKQNGRQVIDAIEYALASKARGMPVTCDTAQPTKST
ncbi:MAG: hypothetical protein RL261_1471 [Pseudomonadota bacterium]|jgi:hypothetical protein